MTAPASDKLSGFLADTWWYGLTQRLSEEAFQDLAELRARQGFTAVQIVVGIPPEVGPENENARSPVGFPWTRKGEFNKDYLQFARVRIQYLNQLGLTVIIYGAWGHQIEWIGRAQMAEWWFHVIETLDDLEVIYCLSGESNLWVGEAHKLLPDKTTAELITTRFIFPWRRHPIVVRLVGGAARRFKTRLHGKQWQARCQAWSSILEQIVQWTDKPVIVHTIPSETGYQAVNNPALLAANTAQTGHVPTARNRIWQLPLQLAANDYDQKGYINLEPWYEGINNQFGAEDQLFAYWASMLAGAISHCYGAHGIWNVGDGSFLAHWGQQSFTQALALDTPRLLSLSHEQYALRKPWQFNTFYKASGNELLCIGKQKGEKSIQFFPDVAKAVSLPDGKIWLPSEGVFVDEIPVTGQAVIFQD